MNVNQPSTLVTEFVVATFYAAWQNVSLNNAATRLRHPTAWTKAAMLRSTNLLRSTPSEAVGAFEKMLLLAWVTKELRNAKHDPFVMVYWDLRPPNILVDSEHNVVGYISSWLR